MLAIKNIEWIGDAPTGHLRLLDQTQLPSAEAYLECTKVQQVFDAIKRLSVRGAPAIGVAAAFGCVLGAQCGEFERSAAHLAQSRPTAVNLFWAIERMKQVQPCEPRALLKEAKKIHEQDAAMCRQIGEHTLPLIRRVLDKDEGAAMLTHCNAGALATGGMGTATAGMYLAHQQGWPIRVFVDETRPLLQGARLTAYELTAAQIEATLICDSMAAQVIREGRIGMVITGADRIAANGDTANKIGTYNLAVLARHHGLPFYIAAPSSTFDLTLSDGAAIPVEYRADEEITEGFGRRTAPAGVRTYNPAFDVTPRELINAIITERGVIEPVDVDSVRRVLHADD